MSWNADGQKICIVYEDGAVIVGSVDGNKCAFWKARTCSTSTLHLQGLEPCNASGLELETVCMIIAVFIDGDHNQCVKSTQRENNV